MRISGSLWWQKGLTPLGKPEGSFWRDEIILCPDNFILLEKSKFYGMHIN